MNKKHKNVVVFVNSINNIFFLQINTKTMKQHIKKLMPLMSVNLQKNSYVNFIDKTCDYYVLNVIKMC